MELGIAWAPALLLLLGLKVFVTLFANCWMAAIAPAAGVLVSALLAASWCFGVDTCHTDQNDLYPLFKNLIDAK